LGFAGITNSKQHKNMNNSIHYNFSDTKPHYQILDGLRGVAALLVLWYHVFEGLGFAGYVNGVSDGMITTTICHFLGEISYFWHYNPCMAYNALL
jgi:uncharacterized membrane protein